MRDIRDELQERAKALGEQINAAQGHFEAIVEQLRREHEGRVANLRSDLLAVNTLMAIELRRHGDPSSAPRAQTQPPQPQAQAEKPRPPISNFLMRRAG
jgi:hypothetical protein